MIDNYTFTEVNENFFEEGQDIVMNLATHTESQVGDEKYDPYLIKATDSNSTLIAGIRGYTQHGWLFISHFWVDESQRGKGIGSKLLFQVEDLARKRGCKKSHTESFTFQAVDFYLKHGYKKFGELADYPEGFSRVYFKKDL